MRLVKMNSPRPGQMVQCVRCYRPIDGVSAWADLDAKAGTFYHSYCVPQDKLNEAMRQMTEHTPGTIRDRLFCGVYSTGISYADKATERGGDFRKLAFLGFRSLELRFEADCPPEFRPLIEADAAAIQAKKGQEFKVSEAGQTVMLGGEA